MFQKIALLGLSFVFCATAFAGETVTYAIEGEPTGLNPQITNSLTAEKLSHILFDRLISFGDTATELKSGLAYLPEENLLPAGTTASTISADGKVYELELRKGVAFHTAEDSGKTFAPTREFNADDVEFTFRRFMDVNHPLRVTAANPKGVYPYWSSLKLADLVKTVEAVNPHRVRITLNQPHRSFLSVLAIPLLSMQSKEYGEFVVGTLGRTEVFDLKPVGTGPFQLKSWVPGRIEFTRFDKHFRGQPQFESVVVVVEKSPAARAKMIADGVVDIVADPSVTDFMAMKSDPKYQSRIDFIQKTAMNLSSLAVNNERVTNPNIRLAISLALDRDQYVQEIFQGNAVAAKSVLYPELNKEFASANYTYNPREAKKLVTGLTSDERKIDLLFMPISRPYNPEGERMAKLMQSNLEAAGFQVQIRTVTEAEGGWGEYLKRLSSGNYQIAQIGLNSVLPLPYDLYSIALKGARVPGGNNWLQWSDDSLEAVVDEIRQADSAHMQPLINQAETIFEKHMPLIPILHSNIFRMVSTTVKGYKLHPLHHEDFGALERF